MWSRDMCRSLGSDCPGLGSVMVSAKYHWACYLIHLDFSLVICKTGILTPIFQTVVRIKMVHTKVSGAE